MSAQRYYQVEAHRHGRGQWRRRGPVHLSKHHANMWAKEQGWVPREEAVNKSRQMVYRLVEVEVAS